MTGGFGELRRSAKDHAQARLAVAGGNDANVLVAVVQAIREGFVREAVITGDRAVISRALPEDVTDRVEILIGADAEDCARRAVAAVRAGEADVLMKGHVDSTAYLGAIVHRVTGIRGEAILSNITVAEMKSYPRLIAATDNGILPTPTLEQKRQLLLNTRALYRGLEYETVHVAALAATEKVSDRLPATVDAATLAADSPFEGFPEFLVDGPFGYDVAVSMAAARIKKLDSSPVAGRADLLLFPTIEAANSVAKSWKLHGAAETGSIVLGAKVPVLLNSRSDPILNRLNGLVLALAALSDKTALSER